LEKEIKIKMKDMCTTASTRHQPANQVHPQTAPGAPRVVHCKKEPYDVYIGRPSKWGNPFSHLEGTRAQFKVSTRQEAIDAYRKWITEGNGRHLLKDLHELEGKTLGCWCKPQACHGDILSELVVRIDQ
jgi:hypothetical protein